MGVQNVSALKVRHNHYHWVKFMTGVLVVLLNVYV